jgi:hypothetical protein
MITATEPDLPRAAEPALSPARPAQSDRSRVTRAGWVLPGVALVLRMQARLPRAATVTVLRTRWLRWP